MTGTDSSEASAARRGRELRERGDSADSASSRERGDSERGDSAFRQVAPWFPSTEVAVDSEIEHVKRDHAGSRI